MVRKLKDPSKLPQEELLRYAMERLNITRQEFADRLDVPKRTLDNWLLQEGSSERRGMPAVVRKFICYYLAHEDA